MPLILPSNSISAVGYEVANSLRFDNVSNDFLNRTNSTPTNNDKCTLSVWVKRSALGGTRSILGFHTDDNNRGNFVFDLDKLDVRMIDGASTTTHLITTQVFRDSSAWYHIVLSVDTTQATASSRVRIYVNGSEVTSFGTETNPSQNQNFGFNNSGAVLKIGQKGENNDFFSGYMSEYCFIDGQQLDPTSFGEFDEDTGIWKPIDVSGLTFGNNGFYLDFENSGSLGADVSGNGNNFTVNNLTSIDQTTDTPTNNYCTFNPLDAYWEASTFSEGNCKIVTESSGYSYNTSTIGLTTGKWYCEVYIEATPPTGTKDSMLGIAGRMTESNTGYLGAYSDTYGMYGANGNIYHNSSSASYGVSHTTGDIIGIYLDLDNNKLYFAKNGTLMNSGTGKDITDVSNTKAGAYFMVAADFFNGASGTYQINFGNPTFTISSGNTDANGYGNFEYDPSSGTFDGSSKDFLAINSKNLAEFG